MNASLCPFAPRLRIWSRGTGLTVPFRVSLLISILRLNLVLVHTYIHSYIHTTVHTNMVGTRYCKGGTRYWNNLEDYWPRAGGLSVMNAIGAQLRNPINSGLDATAESGRNPVRKHQIQSVCVEDEQDDTGRDGLTCLARPNSQARTGTGKYSFFLFS